MNASITIHSLPKPVKIIVKHEPADETFWLQFHYPHENRLDLFLNVPDLEALRDACSEALRQEQAVVA